VVDLEVQACQQLAALRQPKKQRGLVDHLELDARVIIDKPPVGPMVMQHHLFGKSLPEEAPKLRRFTGAEPPCK
jgi:hypothetical protein